MHWLITNVRFTPSIDSYPLSGCKKLPFGLYYWQVFAATLFAVNANAMDFAQYISAEDSSTNAFKVVTPSTVNATTETSVYSAMLNVYYDIETGTKFTPYIGAGLGYARVESKAS